MNRHLQYNNSYSIHAIVLKSATMFKLILKNLISMQILLLIVLMGFMQCANAQNNSGLSLEEASKQVLASSKGKILSAKTLNYNGNRTHRIQVLTSTGRVKIFQIPASKPRFKSNYHPKDRNNRNRTSRYSNQHKNNRRASNLYTKPENQTTTTTKDSKQQ